MERFLWPRLVVFSAYLAAVGVFAAGIWWYGYVAALGQLEQRARSDLALASDSLTGELRRFRELAVLTADHPQLRPVMAGLTPAALVRPVLQRIADKTGALDIMLVDPQGRSILATEGAAQINHAGQPYFTRAMQGALGAGHLYGGASPGRAFVIAAPIFSAAGPVNGALVVFANVEAVESAWRGARPVVFFTDDQGVIFLSNRSELIFRTRQAGANPSGAGMSPFVHYTQDLVGDFEVWDVDGGRYLPARALHLTLDLPVIDMVGEVLVDVGPARQLANLQAAVAAAVCLAFGLLLLVATQRRRTLAALNQRLEQRVRDRTAELSALNMDLIREVAERTAAEARLEKAQDDLLQAAKLSALGQMSAGISHELNQPLTAIRSFAENAQSYLERGKPDIAAQNLGRISEVARRMGRIIRNLRAFARQEDEPAKDVDIVAVIDAVLEIVGPQAAKSGVTLTWVRPSGPIIVRGGEVRLQQVVLNLVSNGMDAMADSAIKEVRIAVDQSGARTRMTVRDTGPGIAEPEKIFEPFYTTKAVGGGDGMGLGLSISYGLVQSFGGAIQGRNHPDGGAIFTVELDSVAQQVAA
ncbi:ATP-binding protein [Yoonia sp.]|uniref:sensor histidine kinase n=1 Tax=Yoonia sp. TaxID=2212373 RepID=UPI001A00569A|nr:ATP-binding protein [Yoonia sp.]MBE0413033.1 sensor histidine kinase [Yoonia sp.]